jgi:cytochrome c-type biogenesis protein CcmH
MTAFWIAASCFVIAALAFVLPALLKTREAAKGIGRDQANVSIYRQQRSELRADLESGALTQKQYAQSIAELERRLLEDVSAREGDELKVTGSSGRWAALLLGVTIPVSAVMLYLGLGTPQALSPQARPEFTAEQVHSMVEQLAARLERNPNDARGWTILARAYSAMGRFDKASAAFGRAVALIPENAQLLADYADAMAMAQGGKLEGEALELVARALKLDSENRKALMLAATAAEMRGDSAGALKYWQRLRAKASDDSEDARVLDERIAETRAALDNRKLERVSSNNTIRGTVRLTPELAEKVQPSGTLFIYAQAISGSKMPIAISRTSAEKLPAAFALDDSTAMMPQNKLSDHLEVRIVARLSKSGNAVPQSGDLQGTSPAVKVGASEVDIVIDQVIP